MESVSLESPSTPGGFRDYIAVGTGFDFAEDRASRGNVSTITKTSQDPDFDVRSRYISLKSRRPSVTEIERDLVGDSSCDVKILLVTPSVLLRISLDTSCIRTDLK